MTSTFGTSAGSSAGTSLVRKLGDGVGSGCGFGCPYARSIEPVGTEITTVVNEDRARTPVPATSRGTGR
jgi:hypothetical protein